MKSIAIAYKELNEINANGINQLNNNEQIDNGHRNDKEIQVGVCDDDIDASSSEFHLNLWKIRSGRFQFKTDYYLDIGIKANFTQNSLIIYLPFRVCENQVTDLSETICKDETLL